jgi:lysophospholipase L1-like esterase
MQRNLTSEFQWKRPRKLPIGFLFALLCAPAVAIAQISPASPQVPASASTQPAKPADDPNNVMTLKTTLDKYKQIFADYVSLSRYRTEDTQARPLRSHEKRVVFMGDSITDSWGHDPTKFFPGYPYLNRGIHGQTTSQMLLRFRQDVIDLHPAAVVILAGTNDIADMTDPNRLQQVEGNYTSMAELAEANHIRVIFSSVTPICGAMLQRRSPDNIFALNVWLRAYALKHGYVYIDYYSTLLDPATGQLRESWSKDCLHPNGDGYRAMEPLVQKGIEASLARPAPGK